MALNAAAHPQRRAVEAWRAVSENRRKVVVKKRKKKLPKTSFSWPRSSSNTGVLCSWLVLLVQ